MRTSNRRTVNLATHLPPRFNLKQAYAAALEYCNSYTRVGAVIALEPLMPHGDWLRLLGRIWSDADALFPHEAALRRLLPDGTTPKLMTTLEQRALAALPADVVIYRGADRGVNEHGLSWTLDQSVAWRFHTYGRHRARRPVLLAARVFREDIIALKLEREEQTVITKSPRQVVAARIL
jgi:hypothetical protein